ncbi:MAG TPA: hypothetical protein VGL08_22710 [Paraburkholderia sp.]|jgi:hypothetical protein
MLANDTLEQELLQSVDMSDVENLFTAMNHTGFGVLHGVVPESVLAPMRDYIGSELEKRDGQYFGLGGPDWIGGSPLNAIFQARGFRLALDGLYQRAMKSRAPSERILPVLRVLAGTHGLRHANRFHYDSYVVTALVPILIPHRPDELPGHLVMFPNMRHVRGSAIVNIIEKVIVESATACRLWRSPTAQRWLGARAVPLEPGNIYFFWGMRSLHANQACLPTSVRSTALFHFGDPHENSVFKRLSQARARASLRRLARK